ncbi:MAG: hydroxymethylbilane synthase [Clostridiales bacterium]|nr:hydroxymethylbilane synthase [Clostridiales bacterium]
MKKEIVIGSRASRLALVQADNVKFYIEKNHPELHVRVLPMKTTGDRFPERPLESIGGKGLFVKELDLALAEGRTDLSVHSLKDVPTDVPEELPLIAFSKREDPRDVLVLPRGCEEPDFSKPVGCSSGRRMIQFRRLYPEVRFQSVRGNVQTRLQKLDEGQYGALILAAAGLKRLGLEDRISRFFPAEEILPAAGQGILAVQGRAGEDYRFLDGYTDASSRLCALAERAFIRRLGGGCSMPAAAFAEIEAAAVQIRLRAMYLDERTGRLHEGVLTGGADEAEQVGIRLAEKFLLSS